MNQVLQLQITKILDNSIQVKFSGSKDYTIVDYTLNARSTNPTWVRAYTNQYMPIKDWTFNIYNLTPSTAYYLQVRAQTASDQPFDCTKILLVTTKDLIPLIDVSLDGAGSYWASFTAMSFGKPSSAWKYSLNGGSWITISNSTATNVQFTLNHLISDRDYTIQVKAVNGSETIYSSELIFTTTKSNYAIGLQEKVTTTDTATFYLHTDGVTYTGWEYQLNDGGWNSFTPTLANEFTINDLRPNKVYKIQVRGIDPNNITKNSQEILFSTQWSTTPYTNLTLLWIGPNSATFNVTTRGDLSSHDFLQYSLSTDPTVTGVWTDIPDSYGLQSVNFTITGLTANTYYYIQAAVKYTNPSDREWLSKKVVFETLESPSASNIYIEPHSIKSTSVTFNVTSETEYRLWEYSMTKNPTENDWITIGDYDVPQDTVSFTISDLNPETSYIIRVRCKIDDDHNYVKSDALSFKTTPWQMTVFEPSENDIVHRTLVDFRRRPITDPIRIVQYDNECPIIAVSLYEYGEPFFIPSSIDTKVNIRFGKPDHTFVYNEAEGFNSDYNIAYFKITKQMTVYHGTFNPVVEYVVGDRVAASGSFTMIIDRNPIQNGDIESSVEYKTVQEYSQEAQHAAEMLQNVSADAVELPQHAPAYATYDPETGTFHFGLPAGGDGGVESVNGKTGVVEIDSSDIPYDSEKTIEEEFQNLEETKANIDGYYENLGAGTADQLVSTTYEEDSVPYSFRTSGGSADVGDLEYDEIVGGTIAWNQLIRNGNFATATYWSKNRCDLTVADNIGRFTCNSAEYTSWGFFQPPSGIVGHKYLAIGSFRCHTVNAARSLTFQSSGNRMINIVGSTRQNDPVNDVWYDLSFIGIYNEISATAVCDVGFASASDITVGTDYIEAKNVMMFDITQMFGPDIADYIYSLEAETTGNGIAYFRKLFPNAYYTTDAGTLMSVKAASHKMIGFNAWDEEWELGAMNDFTGANSVSSSNIRSKNYIRVVPNTTYSIECASGHRYYLFYYDADKNYLGRNDANNKGTFLSDGGTYYRTMTSNCHYVRFFYDATSYNNDFCIHLKWSGYRDGEYEAHKERVYPLDSSLELRGVPEIDSLNKVYYDGDIYKSDGTVIRRYHEVSSVDCSIGAYDAASARWYLAIPNTAPDIVPSLTTEVGKIRTSKYFTTIYRNAISASTKYCITHRDYNTAYSSRQFVFTIDPDIVSTVEEARTWVENHPFNIIYERVESVENAASFISPQWVDDFGTEEYIDYGVQQGDRDVSVPVGHNTKYLQNLRDKLQHLPNLPDPLEDGDYKIHVSGHQMSLIPDDGSGLYDVSFEGYINLISGDYTWFCSKSNSHILDAIDAGSVVRASIVVDNMPDNTMYLCQYSNLDGLVSFYGMALLPMNETNTICYVQLYQSSENSWSSIITPIQ